MPFARTVVCCLLLTLHIPAIANSFDVLERDADALQRDVASTSQALLAATRDATAGSQLPPQNLLARRCEQLEIIADTRRRELVSEREMAIGTATLQIYEAGIGAADADAALRAARQKSPRNPARETELMNERFTPVGELELPALTRPAGSPVVEQVVLELARADAYARLGCAGVLDATGLAAELENASATNPIATFAKWPAAIREARRIEDEATKTRRVQDTFEQALREISAAMRDFEASSEEYRAGSSALGFVTGAARSSRSYRVRSNRPEDYTARDLHLFALTVAFYERAGDPQAFANQLGLSENNLRFSSTGAANQLGALDRTSPELVSELGSWARSTADQILESPETLDAALETLPGE